MAQRLELQELLETFAPRVYFQPPENVDMQFPCIVYSRDGSFPQYADNTKYKNIKRYQVTVIDRNPDSEIPDRVEDLPRARFDRWYAADSLNHYVFNLFF